MRLFVSTVCIYGLYLLFVSTVYIYCLRHIVQSLQSSSSVLLFVLLCVKWWPYN